MKEMVKHLLVVAILLSSALSTWAYSFVDNGIYYVVSYGKTVAVTYKDSDYNSYSGAVVIPSEVTNDGITYTVGGIGYNAFNGCVGLTSVTIPNSVTWIDKCAFCDCSALTSIAIPETVTDIGDTAFSGCTELKSINLPNALKEIKFYTFYNCKSLTSITIPNSVRRIGSSAFRSCSGLTSITIPESVTEMGDGVFGECSELSSVNLPNSLTAIEGSTFYRCKRLTSIKIPSSINRIEEWAFIGCTNLVKVEISDLDAWCNISFGGEYSNPLYFAHKLYLNGDLVTNIVVPASVTKIGDYAFQGCSSLTSVTLHDQITSIGVSAFQECSGLTSITIPDEVTSIGVSAFQKCSGLTSITVPDKVTSIGVLAFENCSKVTALTIGSSVNTIGAYAFDIARLGRIKVLNPEPPTCDDETVFRSVSRAKCVLTVPKGTKDLYKSTYVWWNFSSIEEDEAEGGVEAIGTDALTVSAEDGEIRIAGAAGAVAEVYSLSGVMLYRSTEAAIAMPRGMYIVKVAATTTKVVL